MPGGTRRQRLMGHAQNADRGRLLRPPPQPPATGLSPDSDPIESISPLPDQPTENSGQETLRRNGKDVQQPGVKPSSPISPELQGLKSRQSDTGESVRREIAESLQDRDTPLKEMVGLHLRHLDTLSDNPGEILLMLQLIDPRDFKSLQRAEPDIEKAFKEQWKRFGGSDPGPSTKKADLWVPEGEFTLSLVLGPDDHVYHRHQGKPAGALFNALKKPPPHIKQIWGVHSALTRRITDKARKLEIKGEDIPAILEETIKKIRKIPRFGMPHAR